MTIKAPTPTPTPQLPPTLCFNAGSRHFLVTLDHFYGIEGRDWVGVSVIDLLLLEIQITDDHEGWLHIVHC